MACQPVFLRRLCGVCLLVLLVLAGFSQPGRADETWPQFRGPAGSGIGAGRPPVHWDVETGENVAWKTSIPGLGHSSPIVGGDRIFLTTAVNAEADRPNVAPGWSGGTGESAEDSGDWTWQVLCYRLSDGKQLWSRDACSGKPVIKRHLKASHANCTPATDGKHVIAFFGSEGLVCYDYDGELLWRRELGKLHSGPYDAPELEWGFASSPIIHDGHVVVQCDCLNAHFVAILDIATGKEIRRIDRGDEVATWSTPLVVASAGRTQIVCNGFREMAGYDFQTGERLWSLHDGGDVPVPTPLFANGLIYLTNGHGRSPVYAIRPEATGDLTPSDQDPPPAGLAWWNERGGSYMPTPLVLGKRLYTCNDNGRLTVRHALTGELLYRQRIGSGSTTYSASAVAAAGRLYFASERGEVTVVQAGDAFELAAENEMHELIMATPAIAGDRLLNLTITLINRVRHDRSETNTC